MRKLIALVFFIPMCVWAFLSIVEELFGYFLEDFFTWWKKEVGLDKKKGKG